MSLEGWVVRRTALGLTLLLSLSALAEARAQGLVPDPDRRLGAWALLRYDLDNEDVRERLVPQIGLRSQSTVWRDSLLSHRLVLNCGASAGAPGRTESRRDFGRQLLSPGSFSFAGRVAHEWRTPGRLRVIASDVGLAANFVRWRVDTTAIQVGVRSGLTLWLDRSLQLNLQVARASNALGGGNRKKVLAVTGGDGIWVTFLSTGLTLYSKPGDFCLTGTFAAYLGDSKFPFPVPDRRVLAVAVSKEFEP